MRSTALAMMWLEGDSSERLEDLAARALRIVERRFPARERGTRPCRVAGVEASCGRLVFEQGEGTLYSASVRVDGTAAWIACHEGAAGATAGRQDPCGALFDLAPVPGAR